MCPQEDNEGHSLQRVRCTAEKALAKQFGGFTTTNGKGGWVAGNGDLQREPVWLITVAYDPSVLNDERLTSVARYIGSAGKQQAVYVRYASGDVAVLDTSKQDAIAA